MADNIELNSGSGGSILRTDDDGTAQWQYVKLAWGADNTQTIVVMANALPVQPGTSTTWVLGAGTAEIGKLAAGSAEIGKVKNSGTFAVQEDGAALTALQIMDDWDESDRAKVNIIAGQVGVAAGAGAVGATVPRVTLASDDPAVALLTTIDADTGAIKTALEIIDDWDDGSDHCKVVITAGSAAIGKLAANSGVDIGDVDVTSIVPGTAATNLGKARASALGATDTGVADLAVRNDDLADLAGADGDYTPKQVDNRGALYVNQAAAEPKQASGVAAGGAPGTDDMIVAVGGKKLLILALSLFATSATTNTVYIDNVDNDLLGNSGNGIALSLDADGDTVAGFVLPYNPGGWFKTDAVNEAVTLNSSAAQDIIWCITYIETD